MPPRILFVVPTHAFRDEELLEPRELLQRLGFETWVAAPAMARVHGMRGAHLWPDALLGEVSVLPFDAVVVVGGTGTAEELWGNETLLHLLQRAAVEGKLVAGIGLGVVPLAQSELLSGAHATCYPSDRAIAELEKHGAERVPGDLVDEGNGVITARGPEAAWELGRRIAARIGTAPATAGIEAP